MTPVAELEICVDSLDGLASAVAGGADRLEVCAALALGGLTPGAGLMAASKATGIPAHAMIRPRAGDFCLRNGDLDAMLADVQSARDAGLAGVVIGVAKGDGTLCRASLKALVAAAQGCEVTLHRVFDLTPDPLAAVDVAVDLGIKRILTSGQAVSARRGYDVLARLVSHAAGRIEIMAGGEVAPVDTADLLATGVDALHASCSDDDLDQRDCTRIGIRMRRVTRAHSVVALKAAITSEVLSA